MIVRRGDKAGVITMTVLGDMKVLIVGAGVLGSFYAARLREGGVDVTLLARGRRLADLREHGVVLESALGGRRTVTRVPLTDRLGPDDEYDLAIVIVRRSQIPPVLAMLAANRRIPSVLFLGNNAGGTADLVAALGEPRVLTGFVIAGGERQGYVVRYIYSRWVAMKMGELDGARTPRALAIAGLLRRAGLRVKLEADMDAWLKTHAAGVVPIAGAIYLCGGDVRRLAHTPAALRLYVRSYREGLRALRRAGVPVVPAAARPLAWIPEAVLVLGWRLFLDTNTAVIGAQGHAKAAPDEMKELADELRAIMRRAGLACPASDILFAEIDKQSALAAGPPPPAARIA